ncbi:MAG: chitinase, partial [Kribbellaceae bacterium]|nr:chitinase [Kribbellaceae bacterium]
MRRMLAALAALAIVPLGVVALTAAPAQAASGLVATFSAANNGSWYLDKYVVSNPTSASITGWTIEFDLPAGVTFGQAYNATSTVTGQHVKLVNAYYNGTVAAGATTEPYSPWFVAYNSGATPTGCTINGNKCDGSPDVPPAAPANLRATSKTTTQIALAWDSAAGGDYPVSSYDVYRGSVLATSVTGTSATITCLTANTAYTFTVKSKDTHGNPSAASAPVTVSTNNPANDTTPPTVPGNLHATGKSSTTVSLAWNASTDANGVFGYDVYQGSTLAASVTGTSATVANLAPSTAYTFTVKARDTYDNVSAASTPVSATTDDVVSGYAKIGYFVQWGIYGRQYFVKNLDTTGAAAKLNIVNYAFTNLDPVNLTCMNGVTKGTTASPQDPDQGTGAGDADADYGRPMAAAQSVDGVADTGWEPLRGNFNQLKKLKVKYPNLKIVMSIGGWTYSKFFSDAAATDASRKKFVASCVDMYLKGNLPLYNGAGGAGVAAGIFDGLDIDWEWVGSPDGHAGNHYSANDKANLTALLAEFRTQMDAYGTTTGKHYLLTAFTPADPGKINAGWDLSHIFTSLDIANVQGYDFHGAGSDNSWEPNRTGHQANLYNDTQDPYSFHFSVDSAVQAYLSAGVSPRKITVGLPFYGRGWQGVADGGVHGEWQSATGAAPGQFAEEAGTRGYSNLVASVPGCTVYH